MAVQNGAAAIPSDETKAFGLARAGSTDHRSIERAYTGEKESN